MAHRDCELSACCRRGIYRRNEGDYRGRGGKLGRPRLVAGKTINMCSHCHTPCQVLRDGNGKAITTKLWVTARSNGEPHEGQELLFEKQAQQERADKDKETGEGA